MSVCLRSRLCVYMGVRGGVHRSRKVMRSRWGLIYDGRRVA